MLIIALFNICGKTHQNEKGLTKNVAIYGYTSILGAKWLQI